MRTLNKNKTKLWMVKPTGTTPLLDGDGFDTGEVIKTYSTPITISINLFPSNGSVVERIFGKDASLDMVAVSNDVIMSEDTLLFLQEPVGDYYRTYDYNISSIKHSLNTHNYGLKRRT